MVNIDK